MFPDATALLSISCSCGGEKITRIISILFSKNNSQELAWTKDHSQKGSMDAVILFWKVRQFKTTKMYQLILSTIFHMGIDIAIVFLSSLFLRNVKKP